MVSNEAIAAVANEAAAAINVLNGLLSASGNNKDNGRQESDNGSGEKSGSGGAASPGGKIERSGSGSTKEDKEIRASLDEAGALDDAAKSAELVNNDDKTQKAVNKQVSGKNVVSNRGKANRSAGTQLHLSACASCAISQAEPLA